MKRGVKTIIAGVVLFITGAVFVPVACILLLIFNRSNDVQFKVPGTKEINIEKPGRYYLWNDYQTIYHGKSYSRSKHIPDGMEIKIRDADGAPLSFIADTSISSEDNGLAENSIGYVEVKSPGKVEIEISGGNEERIFSFAPSNILKIVGLIFGTIGLSALIAISGIAVGIWGIVKLAGAKK